MCAARHFYRKVLARRKIVIVEIAIMVIDITQISAVYKKRGSPIKIQLHKNPIIEMQDFL